MAQDRRWGGNEGYRLREKLAAWAAQIGPKLNPYPVMPEGVTDRAADVWESLLAIADAVGENVSVVSVSGKAMNIGSWPQMARVSCVSLVSVSQGEAPSLGVRLLMDLKTVFSDREAMFTGEVLVALANLDESPWGDLKGKPLDARRLANLLRPYEIVSKSVRVEDKILKGYAATDLFDAWTRYIPMKSTLVTTGVSC